MQESLVHLFHFFVHWIVSLLLCCSWCICLRFVCSSICSLFVLLLIHSSVYLLHILRQHWSDFNETWRKDWYIQALCLGGSTLTAPNLGRPDFTSGNKHRFLLFIGPLGQCIIWEWDVYCRNVCLPLHLTVSPSWSMLPNWFFLLVLHSFSFLSVISEWDVKSGVILSFFPLHCHVILYLSLSLLLFMLDLFLFSYTGTVRVSSLRFIRRSLLYLLNTTNLTLLNILLARTGHTELQATPHVNTGAHSLKLGRKELQRGDRGKDKMWLYQVLHIKVGFLDKRTNISQGPQELTSHPVSSWQPNSNPLLTTHNQS